MITNSYYPRFKSPILICAWPGMGEVAIRAAMHLKEAMAFKEFARLEAPEYFEPSGVLIKEGVLNLPKSEGGIFYYYKDPKKANDLILFISDAQPNLGNSVQYAEQILTLAQRHKVKLIYTFAAMTVPIDHNQESRVWIAGSSKKIVGDFRTFNLKTMNEGQISGLNGLILGLAKNKNIDGICLLGEIPIYTIQIENPKASLAVLGIFAKRLNIELNFSALKERIKFVEEEINKLIGYIKGDLPHSGPLSEEDIEKIKKELAAFTKLPESARKKIEDLFKLAAGDLSKAVELKNELDVWSVFKEYEDRFLDLFKKKHT